jgi:hypothetical protein
VKPTGRRVVLHLRELRGDRPFHTRVRQGLKHLLRAQQLRCDLIEWPDGTQERPAGASEGDEGAPGPPGQEVARPGASVEE